MITITIYLQGGYGQIGTGEAVQAAINRLKPHRLHDQICLRTKSALSRIEFIKADKVPK